jgi:hypothetical protein
LLVYIYKAKVCSKLHNERASLTVTAKQSNSKESMLLGWSFENDGG